ncbi:hypothetical protein [Streptomyces griseofuscus]|uniref:hypothetical protein n=1 Tax=Streptomyces griseofuscus TaxID=146922 RepID=UPI003454432F
MEADDALVVGDGDIQAHRYTDAVFVATRANRSATAAAASGPEFPWAPRSFFDQALSSRLSGHQPAIPPRLVSAVTFSLFPASSTLLPVLSAPFPKVAVAALPSHSFAWTAASVRCLRVSSLATMSTVSG